MNLHSPLSFLKNALSSKWIILFIFLFGLIARLFVGLCVGYKFHTDYATIAQNIVQGKGYSLDGIHPTAYRTPGYPLILAALMALFGKDRPPLIILMAIVGASNASLCAWLGIKLFELKAGLIAGLLYILVPYLAQKEATTEGGLVTLGLLAALCLLWKGWKSRNLIFMLPSGLIFAFSYLVRPTIGLIPVFISIILLVAKRQSKKANPWHITSALIFLLTFLMGIMPWAVRNKKFFGRLYFGQTNFWYNVYIGNHTRTFEIYPYLSLDNFILMIPPAKKPNFTNEFEKEQWFRQQAITEILKLDLKDHIKRCSQRLFYLWGIRIVPYTDRIGNDPLTNQTLDKKRSTIKNLAFSIPYVFLLIFAFIGCWQERKRKGLLLFIMGLLFSFSIPYMITIAYSRYTSQMYFAVILLAARGLVSLVQIKDLNI